MKFVYCNTYAILLLHRFGDANLNNVMLDFFLAGSETTSTSLNWSMLFMANYPEIQKKVQKELDEVTGGARVPTMQVIFTDVPFKKVVCYT